MGDRTLDGGLPILKVRLYEERAGFNGMFADFNRKRLPEPGGGPTRFPPRGGAQPVMSLAVKATPMTAAAAFFLFL